MVLSTIVSIAPEARQGAQSEHETSSTLRDTHGGNRRCITPVVDSINTKRIDHTGQRLFSLEAGLRASPGWRSGGGKMSTEAKMLWIAVFASWVIGVFARA
jgi:hypothetical protein